MDILNQDGPLLAWHTLKMRPAMGISPGTGFSKTKRSCVAWIVQSIQRNPVAQRLPDQLAGTRLPMSGEF
jgi:ABC-type thiamine transport system ATPase subunit